jgi:hypothetical protein
VIFIFGSAAKAGKAQTTPAIVAAAKDLIKVRLFMDSSPVWLVQTDDEAAMLGGTK